MRQTQYHCQVGDDDAVTVAADDYDDEYVYVTMSEHNPAGVMTHHIGVFLAPSDAWALGSRLMTEATAKTRKGGWFRRG